MSQKKITLPLWAILLLSGIFLAGISVFAYIKIPEYLQERRENRQKEIETACLSVIQKTLTKEVEGKTYPLWTLEDASLYNQIKNENQDTLPVR